MVTSHTKEIINNRILLKRKVWPQLYEESIRDLSSIHLSSERLHRVHDFLLVSYESDAQLQKNRESDLSDVLHALVASLAEDLRVTVHFDATQPLLQAGVAGQVWDIGVQELVGAVTGKGRDFKGLRFEMQLVSYTDWQLTTHFGFAIFLRSSGARISLSRVLTMALNLGRWDLSFCQQSNIS